MFYRYNMHVKRSFHQSRTEYHSCRQSAVPARDEQMLNLYSPPGTLFTQLDNSLYIAQGAERR